MSRVFAHGALRLYMLSMLEDRPRHGYELIQLLEDRFLGMYTPSAGTIYPRLSSLEEDGLVEHDVVDGKRVYRLTEAGRAELDARRTEIDRIGERAAASARDLAREVRDVRREERRSNRRASRAGSRRVDDRALQAELDAFVGDVLAGAGTRTIDPECLAAVRDALLDARRAVAQALDLSRPAPASVSKSDAGAGSRTNREG
ncbi:MAG TPA: PadR family transcriptional regulator [Acidimicrobiia bacterium]|nr:PadR family transcriptional regulator [Acidimicrobiia bacterium]